VRLSREQRLVRAGVIGAIDHLLRDFWKQENADPLPDRITQLLTELGDGTSSESAQDKGP
jgi:hypothetical protein